ncbi:MAG: VWA domain-containing protein [Anaerolineales bacterium]
MRRTQFILATLLVFGTVFALVQPAYSQSNVTLLIHNVSVQLSSDESAHEISLIFSLLDSGGNPIRDAQAKHFTLFEDNQPASILSLGSASDQPISVLLLLDTSGSMTGVKIEAARNAAARFIDNLQSGDQVAVLTFDRRTVIQIDFTADHRAARQVVELVQATPGGATCLYDTAYQAIQMIANQPAGRRALILLTDGTDEAGGRPCSYHTLDDVISLASAGQTRVPIYTIGLGESINRQVLERLARQTQGRYQHAPSPTQLEALFGRLTDELRSQYVLRYRSVAQAGEHSLTLRVNYRGAQEQVSLFVDLPPLPYRLIFLSPANNAQVQGSERLQVQVTGQGVPIQKIVFLANGVPIGSDEEPPYELEWDPAGLAEGNVLLEAIAQDAAGVELTRGGVTVTYHLPEKTSESTPVTEKDTLATSPSWFVFIAAGAAALLLLGGVVLLVVVRQRKKEMQRQREWEGVVQGVGVEAATGISEDYTLDAFAPSEKALAVLVVLQSDDPDLLHRRIEITKATTTLGRKADNDIAFPKDSPVSRHHAVIEERNGSLYLSEVLGVDESGRPKRPAYGTFVNGTQVQDPVRLRDGDEIQLGKRLRLRFEAVRLADSGEEYTIDQLTHRDEDKTIDFGR